jgi:hypothetical protein
MSADKQGQPPPSLPPTDCSRLVWTTDTPTQNGWYWLRGGDSYGWWEGCVEIDLKDGDCFFEGEWTAIVGILPNAEWSNGAITEPISPANEK